jgi:hypothetical protein
MHRAIAIATDLVRHGPSPVWVRLQPDSVRGL